jgi:hypothetical protein
MTPRFLRTPASREKAVDGLNLFFGALLGANLGTLEGLKLVSYVQLAVILAGTVMALRMVSSSDNRVTTLIMLAVYAVLLAGLVMVPDIKPDGMEVEDLHKLVGSLAVWVIFVLAIEFAPAANAPVATDVVTS